MMSKTDGGPAYPKTGHFNAFGGETGGSAGMTLRDYFAAHAPWARANFLGGEPTDVAVERVAQDKARLAYAFADAMLVERSKP